MSYTELVIKLPDRIHYGIEKGITVNGSSASQIVLDAVKKGTILPKGHGDLIDRRELKKDVYTTTEWNGDVHRIIYEASVDDAPTIIEADKAEQEATTR